MLQSMKRIAVASGLSLVPLLVVAAEPVKYIGVYVLPYYESAQSKDGRPRIAVAKKYDEQLSLNKQEEIVAVRDMIQGDPQLITPMTLMVLAIRLYDVGLRDDSVFWFYVAKDRYVTLSEVLEIRSPALSQVEQATRDFAVLAGPTINGYAFCNIKKQKELRMKALEWVEQNPYQVIFIPQLPAKPGDRHTNLERALEKLRASVKEDGAYLDQTDNLAKLVNARRENGADEKYCWQ
jgi:hypothetical protein